MARCPALAALVPSQSSPSSPATVRIDTMSPAVFQELLHFLYTGRIHSTRISEELVEAAKFYEVETLHQVGMTSGERLKIDHEDLSKFIMYFDV